MSDRLRQVFEKHSKMSIFDPTAADPELLRSLTFDQFEAAVKELMPSDEEIERAANVGFKSHQNHYFGFNDCAKWFRSHILGTDKKEEETS